MAHTKQYMPSALLVQFLKYISPSSVNNPLLDCRIQENQVCSCPISWLQANNYLSGVNVNVNIWITSVHHGYFCKHPTFNITKYSHDCSTAQILRIGAYICTYLGSGVTRVNFSGALGGASHFLGGHVNTWTFYIMQPFLVDIFNKLHFWIELLEHRNWPTHSNTSKCDTNKYFCAVSMNVDIIEHIEAWGRGGGATSLIKDCRQMKWFPWWI